MADKKTTTTGDRFSVTVHVASERKFLRGPEYHYTVVIRDEQEIERQEKLAMERLSFGGVPSIGLGSGVKRFETDDADALIEAFAVARDALADEVR